MRKAILIVGLVLIGINAKAQEVDVLKIYKVTETTRTTVSFTSEGKDRQVISKSKEKYTSNQLVSESLKTITSNDNGVGTTITIHTKCRFVNAINRFKD